MSKIRFTNTSVTNNPPAWKLYIFMENWILKQRDENWIVIPVVNWGNFWNKSEIWNIDHDFAMDFDNIYL